MKPNKKTIAGITGATALIMGGVDLAVLDVQPIERTEVVAEERVISKQVGNIVETELPWKGETGIKVKYDMGVASADERLRDKRDKQVITELVDFGDGGFKVDIILDKKPDTNVFCYEIEGHENYDFFYQPALTQEEIAEGRSRDESMVGSYAVYHKSLKDNEYKTGKVMHIPRPEVWEVDDQARTTEWAELSYSEGSLCVTAKQEFLDNAKYPVRIDPTFGYTSLGASNFTAINEFANGFADFTRFGSRISPAEDGTLISATVYLDPIVGLGNFKIAIAEYNGSSHPLVAYSTEATADDLAAKQYTVNFSGEAVFAADQYILSLIPDHSTFSPTPANETYWNLKYDTTSSQLFVSEYISANPFSSTWYSTPSDPWTTASAFFQSETYSIYATYGNPIKYETGQETISDSLSWNSVTFENTYTEPPVIFATPVTAANCEDFGACAGATTAATGGEVPIPIVRNVTTTGFDFSMCIDAGSTTCQTGSLAETFHWFAFEPGTTDAYDWIEVGTSTVATNGSDTSITLKNSMANTPAVWTQAQTYSQGSNIAAHAWTEDTATMSNTAIILIGCTHQGTGNTCDVGTPSEEFGYIAIDLANEAFPAEAGFQSGSADISNSQWTAASFSPAYTSPRVMVTQNDDDGGEDPEYAWSRNVTTTGMQYRFCEADGGNTCNSHTGEVVRWFALEATAITTPAVESVGQSIIWFD